MFCILQFSFLITHAQNKDDIKHEVIRFGIKTNVYFKPQQNYNE